MPTYTIAEASARLDELIDAAARGETVLIAQADGRLVQLAPAPRVTLDDLRAARESRPMSPYTTADLVRMDRDEGY